MTYKKITKDDFQNPYKEFTQTLAANQRLRIAYDTSYFRLLSVTGSMKVNFYGQAGDTTIIGSGIGIKFDPIKWIELIDTSGAPNLCTVALGICEIFDSRFIAGGVTNVNQTKSATFTGINRVTIDTAGGGGFLKQVVPADATRRTVIVTADPANNAAGIVLGGLASTGATQGSLLVPGQSFPIDSGAETWAFATVNTDKVWLSAVKD